MKKLIFTFLLTILICVKSDAGVIDFSKYQPKITLQTLYKNEIKIGPAEFNIEKEDAKSEYILHLTTNPIEFNAQNFPELKPVIKRFIGGTITPKLNITINKKDFSVGGYGNIKIDKITFDGENFSTSNISGEIPITNLSPFKIDNAKINTSFIFWNDLNIFNGSMRFSANEDTLTIKGGGGRLDNGAISFKPGTTPIKNNSVTIPLLIKDMPISDLFKSGRAKNLYASGTISGELPIKYNFKENNFSIKNGSLFSDNKGQFSYSDKINNFDYDVLQFAINTSNTGQTNIKSILRGYQNNKPTSINLDLSQLFERLFN